MLYLARIDLRLPPIDTEHLVKKFLENCLIFYHLFDEFFSHRSQMIKLLLIILDESFLFELTKRDATAPRGDIHV